MSDTQKHYKAIVVIISSLDKPVYKQFKQLQSLYLDLYKDDIKYFFIELSEECEVFHENLMWEQDIIEKNNFIYVKGKESIIPGVYNKTMKAFNYICKNYSFDFIVRTNLSTIWNIPYLFKYLYGKPREKYASGFLCRHFISGIGIILSKDVCKLLSENIFNTNDTLEDMFISQVLQNLNINIDFIDYNNNKNEYRCIHFVKDNIDSKKEFENIDYSNFLCIRLKNSHNREIIDIFYFTTILKDLYNLHPYDYPQNLFT